MARAPLGWCLAISPWVWALPQPFKPPSRRLWPRLPSSSKERALVPSFETETSLSEMGLALLAVLLYHGSS